MYTWLSSKRAPVPTIPQPVPTMLERLGDLRTLVGVRSAEGGIKRESVLVGAARRLEAAGLSTGSRSYMDATGAGGQVGFRVEAGRAHTNNDGLLAVLQAASDPQVRVLLLAVPDVYKGSVTAARAIDRVSWVLTTRGIELELLGVAILPY